MCLGIRQVQRLRGQCDRANQTFTQLQSGHMDGIRVEPLRREQFKDITRALHIDRAHFGRHFRRDDFDDFIQSVLCGPCPRHDLAETAQRRAVSCIGATVHYPAPLARPLPSSAATA